MKIQPMQQIADHLIRSYFDRVGERPSIDRDIRAGVCGHGRVDRAIRDQERFLARLKHSPREGDFSIARLHNMAACVDSDPFSARAAVSNMGKALK